MKKQPSSASTAPRNEHKASTGVESKDNKANAVVIKRQKTIEVLNLDSGQPLCSYGISKDASVGDVNGDNVIDHVTTYFTSERVDQSGMINPCSAVVTSGAKTLFSGSICLSSSVFGSIFDWISEEDARDEAVLVSPLLVQSPPDKRGISSPHLSGQTFKRESIRSFDSVLRWLRLAK